MSPRPASRPAIEMSSSRSSQCRPMRLISTRCLASALAFKRRGNHARGTPNVRPSDSSTHIVCSSKRTAVAEIVIPGLQDGATSLGNDMQDTRKFDGIEAITLGDGYLWLKPHLGVSAAAFDVNVPWLARKPFVGEKEIAQASIAEDNRHFSPQA